MLASRHLLLDERSWFAFVKIHAVLGSEIACVRLWRRLIRNFSNPRSGQSGFGTATGFEGRALFCFKIVFYLSKRLAKYKRCRNARTHPTLPYFILCSITTIHAINAAAFIVFFMIRVQRCSGRRLSKIQFRPGRYSELMPTRAKLQNQNLHRQVAKRYRQVEPAHKKQN